MQIIDMNTWHRKEHFQFFYAEDFPQYSICTQIDITHFLDFVHENKLPFYYSMIHAAMTAANRNENFRYRIRDGQVVLHDRIHPTFTDLEKGSDLFKIVTVNMSDDFREFTGNARAASSAKRDFFPDAVTAKRDDLVYVTCLPWISFTQVSHTFNLNANDAAPRFVWGKYFEVNGRQMLPFSIQVNHALVDGVHVGQFVTDLGKYLDAL